MHTLQLSTGHFLSPERVEGVIVAACPDVVACVVAPGADNASVVAICATRPPGEGEAVSVSSLAVMAAACRAAGVPPSNIPAAVLREDVSQWTAANGCLTANMKVNQWELLCRSLRGEP